MLRETAKATSLLALAAMLHVKVYDSTIRNGQNKCGLFERIPREKFLLSKKQHGCRNHVTFLTLSVEQTQPRWRCLATMNSAKIAYQHKLLIPAVKHVGRGVMIASSK